MQVQKIVQIMMMDILLSDESTSIAESNLVDTVASDSESDQENGVVNGDSPEYCDL